MNIVCAILSAACWAVRDWFHCNFHTRVLLILATLYTHQHNLNFSSPLAYYPNLAGGVSPYISRGHGNLALVSRTTQLYADATSRRLPSHAHIFFQSPKIYRCWLFVGTTGTSKYYFENWRWVLKSLCKNLILRMLRVLKTFLEQYGVCKLINSNIVGNWHIFTVSSDRFSY